MFIFGIHKIGFVFHFLVSHKAFFSGSRIKSGISAALRGLRDLLSFQRAGGRTEGPLISRGGRAFGAKRPSILDARYS